MTAVSLQGRRKLAIPIVLFFALCGHERHGPRRAAGPLDRGEGVHGSDGFERARSTSQAGRRATVVAREAGGLHGIGWWRPAMEIGAPSHLAIIGRYRSPS
jgi:hypothetical protein